MSEQIVHEMIYAMYSVSSVGLTRKAVYTQATLKIHEPKIETIIGAAEQFIPLNKPTKTSITPHIK